MLIELKSLCTHFESDISITPQEPLITLPVSVASAERSFSKLKLIKSYIQTTMTKDRLNALSSLSIEQ